MDQETLKLIVIPLRVFRWTVVISRGLVFKVNKHCKRTLPYRIKVTNRITLCASSLDIKLPSNSFPFFPCFNFQNVKTQFREPGLCLVTPGNDTLLIAPPGSWQNSQPGGYRSHWDQLLVHLVFASFQTRGRHNNATVFGRKLKIKKVHWRL